MTAWRAAVALALALLLGGCGVNSVVVQKPAIPEQPVNSDLVGPAIVVAEGDSALGPYRAWIYRIRDGSSCFELATPGVVGTGCGTGAESTLGVTPLEVEGGYIVGGGTSHPARTAVVHTVDGGEVRGPVELAAPGLAGGLSYFVVAVPGGVPESVDLLGADGTVLETLPVRR